MRAGLALLAASQLGACQYDMIVDILQHGDAVTFEVRNPADDRKRVCISSLDVRDRADLRTELWDVASARSQRELCLNRFTYGQVPSGFSQERPAAPLSKGKTYQVSVSGFGLTGGRYFTLRDTDTSIGRDTPKP